MAKEKIHKHPSMPQIECEKCSGEVTLKSAAYPQAYECTCRKCGHRFRWVNADADPYS